MAATRCRRNESAPPALIVQCNEKLAEMTLLTRNWGTFHPSTYHDIAGPVRGAVAEPRASGAARYRCPTTGSLILVTDDDALRQLEQPAVRLRCGACGEMHMLTSGSTADATNPDFAVIVDDKDAA